jgi:replicative DNA helicase
MYDHEAEQNLLGGLLDGGNVGQAVALVQVNDFYRERHQHIYNAIRRLYINGVEVSPVSVASELRRNGHDEVNENELHELRQEAITTTFAAAHVGEYAERVRDLASDRKLQRTLEQGIRVTQDAALTPTEKLTRVQSDVMALGNDHKASDLADGADLAAAVLERWKRRQQAQDGLMGLSWGLTDMNAVTGGLQRGMLYIIGGRPSMGKTWLALHAARHAAVKEGKRVLIMSLEMGYESIGERIAMSEACISTDQLPLPTPRIVQKYTEAMHKLETSTLWVDDASELPYSGLVARALKLHHRAPLDLIVVDYLQLINTADADSGSTRATQIGNLSRALKILARKLDIPVVVLSQLNRSLESRPNKRPLLSDLRESGGIEQDADVVMFIYRDVYYDANTDDANVAEVIIAKQREGRTGTVKVRFDADTGAFRNLAAYEPSGVRS